MLIKPNPLEDAEKAAAIHDLRCPDHPSEPLTKTEAGSAVWYACTVPGCRFALTIWLDRGQGA